MRNINVTELDHEMSRLDLLLENKYLLLSAGVPSDRMDLADMFLQSTIELCLMRAKDMMKTKEEIEEILHSSAHWTEISKRISIKKALGGAVIRRDFLKALNGVSNGARLSGALGYGFYPSDIKALAALHKQGKCRQKIEELLTDCNFHCECDRMSSGRYEEWI